MSREMVEKMPKEMVPDDLRQQAIDIEFHWVTESGSPGKLTSGVEAHATVSVLPRCNTIPIPLIPH